MLGFSGASSAYYATFRIINWDFIWVLRWLTERILMRFDDIVMSMPSLILAFAFVAMLSLVLLNGALALALTAWLMHDNRSEIQHLRNSDYLAAAEMMELKRIRLLWGHILPLCLPSAIVRLALNWP